ncbi:unnamed protein product [Auanema sp. JU1783]|nr:unnamed protein product [Auanema sp. JU1783]
MTSYGPLAQIAVVATTIFVVGSASMKRRPVLINGCLALVVASAMLVYSFCMKKNILQLPALFIDIVFEPNLARKCLLTFFFVNVLASVIFATVVTMRGKSSTIHRKFFHLTVSLIYLSGLFLDKDFVWLAGWLSLCIFIIVEVLRYYNVPPWGETLNHSLLIFKDAQDSNLLLTPIYLLLGVFLPLFLSPNDEKPMMYHLAGVAAVGVGDSLAAIVGSSLGRNKWPGRQKTIEGSLAMCLGMIAFFEASIHFIDSEVLSFVYISFVSVVLTLLEAFVVNVDNVLLPLIGYILL